MSRAASLETVTLTDAVDRVRELSVRLWAVRAAHPARRGLRGLRCTTCGQAWPCPTVRATVGGTPGSSAGGSPGGTADAQDADDRLRSP